MSPTLPESSTSPRGPPMPSQRLRLMPMPTTATDTVLDTVMVDTVWDTPDITSARGLLMPSLLLMLMPMPMLTTAMADITAADTDTTDADTDIADADTDTHTEDMDMATTTASKPKKLPSSILHSCSDRISVLSVKRE